MSCANVTKRPLRSCFYFWLNKPEYWFQPRRLLRKLAVAQGQDRGEAAVRLPWGLILAVHPHETIGHSLLQYGVYDLAVSEALWRLTNLGETCLDVGANVGYLTSLLAVRAGPTGKVFAFEPHPRLFDQLESNMMCGWTKQMEHRVAVVSLQRLAIGARNQEMELVEPNGFVNNEGLATLVAPTADLHAVRHRVLVRTLDTLFSDAPRLGILKVDVEGAEPSVFQGAARLLEKQQIRDIVFEDFRPFPSECARILTGYGFAIRRLGKSLLGPVLLEPSDRARVRKYCLPWEPMNYLATLDLKRAEGLLRLRGWACLRRIGSQPSERAEVEHTDA